MEHLKILLISFTKHASLVKRSIVLSIPTQLVFPALDNGPDSLEQGILTEGECSVLLTSSLSYKENNML